ncbi:MAG TPA: 4-hydroxythreonine-4-phosphate dehydrogenase PdxA [Kiloniellales bacterium]
MSPPKGPDTRNTPRPLALTMGEPAGIGGEIALLAWHTLARAPVPGSAARQAAATFFVIDDPARLAALARSIASDAAIAPIASPAEAVAVFPSALPVLSIPVPKAVAPGRPARENAAAVIASIERAVDLVRAGEAAAVITNPIHKGILYDGGFRFPGHTEFLADLAGGGKPVMMLTCPGLRVVPVTIHLPLARAAATLTAEAIVHAGRVTAAALRDDFAIARPRLAVAGLNPHAGEGGALGREEIDIIAPAVATLRDAGIDVAGPAPADTLFHPAARQGYDAALCMYHDQALIPVKTIDFEHGVNITLGLPFVRTSPDHGTAFDIAGTGRASPASLLAALATAGTMAAARAAARRRSVA